MILVEIKDNRQKDKRLGKVSKVECLKVECEKVSTDYFVGSAFGLGSQI